MSLVNLPNPKKDLYIFRRKPLEKTMSLIKSSQPQKRSIFHMESLEKPMSLINLGTIWKNWRHQHGDEPTTIPPAIASAKSWGRSKYLEHRDWLQVGCAWHAYTVYIYISTYIKHEIIYCNRDTSVYIIHTCCQAFSNWDCSTRVSTCLDAKVYGTSVYVVMSHDMRDRGYYK